MSFFLFFIFNIVTEMGNSKIETCFHLCESENLNDGKDTLTE